MQSESVIQNTVLLKSSHESLMQVRVSSRPREALLDTFRSFILMESILACIVVSRLCESFPIRCSLKYTICKFILLLGFQTWKNKAVSLFFQIIKVFLHLSSNVISNISLSLCLNQLFHYLLMWDYSREVFINVSTIGSHLYLHFKQNCLL